MLLASRITTTTLLACLLWGSPLAARSASRGADQADAAPAAMPQSLVAEDHDFPIWVDERAALLPSGEVNSTIFHHLVRKQLEAYLRLPAREGKIWLQEIEQEIVNAPVRRDVAEAVRTSAIVLLAKVTGRSQGFHGEIPGSLLRISPVRRFKGALDHDEYFVFIPVGEIHLGATVLSKVDSRYPALPDLGDQVLLFVAPDWRNTGSFLWLSDDASLVTIKDKSGVSLPRKYLKANSALVGSRREVVEKLVGELTQRGRDN